MNRALVLGAGAAAAIVIGAVLWWRSGREGRARSGEAAAALREMVLSRRIMAEMPKPATNDAVRGVAMDWNVGGGLATLVAIDDGTVSLYLNPGGGVLGAGTHADVATVAERFRLEASRQRHLFTATDSYSPPGRDSITFFLLTDSATLTSGAIPSRELEQSRHPLAGLGATAQELFTAVRRAR